MPHVIDDATSAMHDAYDETTSMLDNIVPLGEFLDEQLARVRENKLLKLMILLKLKIMILPLYMNCLRYLRVILWMKKLLDFFACNDRDDLKKLLAKLKEKSLNSRMQYDPKFATSLIFVTDKDHEFSVDPELITVVESDPFHGYESETVVAHLTKLNDIATLFIHEKKFAITIFLNCFLSH